MSPEFRNPAIGSLADLSPAEFASGVLRTGITWGLIIGGIAFFFLFVWGGVSWITSGGDKAQIEDARQKIKNAIVGLVVLLAVFFIIQIFEGLLGISLMNFDLGELQIG